VEKGITCLETTGGGIDDEHSAICLRGSSDHVLDEITMSWGVNDSAVVLRGLELPESDIDGDTTLALGLQFVQNLQSSLEATQRMAVQTNFTNKPPLQGRQIPQQEDYNRYVKSTSAKAVASEKPPMSDQAKVIFPTEYQPPERNTTQSSALPSEASDVKQPPIPRRWRLLRRQLLEMLLRGVQAVQASAETLTQAYLKDLLFISAASFSNFSMTRLSIPPSL
jgi:hypothetical protein